MNLPTRAAPYWGSCSPMPPYLTTMLPRSTIVEAQATPRLARMVIEKVREVTEKPISHLVMTHYHAVRVLGASAYGAREIIMSDVAAAMVEERGQEDWDSEFDRFPRLFQGHEEIPGLTRPTTLLPYVICERSLNFWNF